MKAISKKQLISIWICVFYWGIVSIQIGARAMWGFLRITSEYREDLIPREILVSITESAVKDYWNHTILVLIGFVLLLINAIWITRNKNIKNG